MSHAQLTALLLQSHPSFTISPAYLHQFLTNHRHPLPPIPALLSTIRFRILASDIKLTISPPPHQLLPTNINDITIRSRILPADVIVQVLDMTDVGISKWSQVEAIERVERGEEVKGREVIRTVPGMDENGDDDYGGSASRSNGTRNAAEGSISSASAKKSMGPHRLTLQDSKGTNVTAFEIQDLPAVFIGEGGMSIGCKIILKQGTEVKRGLVMLVPENVVVMGGKVEVWDRAWREGRKGKLVEDVQRKQEGD